MDASTEDSEGVDATSDATSDVPGDVQEQGSIRGSAQLLDREEHGGITISLAQTNLTTSTNPAGEFELTAVPVGTHTLTASFHPYQSQVITVIVEPNKTTLLDPLVLRLTRLLHAGHQDIPLALTPSGDFALFGSDYDAKQDTLTLWVHTVEKDESVETSPGVSRTTLLTSPDGKALSFLRNFDAKSGLGELVGTRLGSGPATSLSQAIAEGKYWFSRDGHYITYLSDFDEASNAGTLHAVSTLDWSSRLLATNVALKTIEEHEDGKVLWFLANLTMDPLMYETGELYRYEFGAIDATKVDVDVSVGDRWLGGLGQPVLYLKDSKGLVSGLLVAWSPNESPQTLGTSVSVNSFVPSPDGKEVLFISDFSSSTWTGTLRRWIAGTATPTTVAESVFDIFLPEFPSHFLYLHDFDLMQDTGIYAVWDFGTGKSYDLGISGAPWDRTRNGHWVGYYKDFDKNAWSGDLTLFDLTTHSSTLVAKNASGYCMEFDLESKWLLYHLNGNPSTHAGDLYLYDLATKQNTLLAQNASQFTSWNKGSSMIGFFTNVDPLKPEVNVHVRALDIGKTVSLGQAANILYLGPSGHWVAFYRNISNDGSSADLWVWDGSVDPWEGSNVGIEIKKNVGGGDLSQYSEGLLMTEPGEWPLVTASWWSRTARQWSDPITDAKIDMPAMSPDHSRVFFFAKLDAASFGDLYLIDPTCPDPILLGSRVHEEEVWVDDEWMRAVFLKNVVGGVGELVVRDLTLGTSRELGTSSVSYGTIMSPKGNTVGFLHAWDGTVGTLSALGLGDTAAPPLRYDDKVNITSRDVPYVISDKNVLYTVTDDLRSGTYLASTP